MVPRTVASLLLALAALFASGRADAQMMGPGGTMMGLFAGGTARGGELRWGPVNMGNAAAGWLQAMHEQLGISPAQEPAWQAFAQAVAADAAALQAYRTSMSQLPTGGALDRALLREDFLADRLERATAVADALVTLDAVLTPTQRTSLDEGYALQCGRWGLFGD